MERTVIQQLRDWKMSPSLKGIRFSMSDYRDQQWMKNIPLYACKCL